MFFRLWKSNLVVYLLAAKKDVHICLYKLMEYKLEKGGKNLPVVIYRGVRRWEKKMKVVTKWNEFENLWSF